MNPYRFFSLVFSYPSHETLKALSEMKKEEWAREFSSPDALNGVPVEELQAEYTKLFISAYPKLLCPPYESFYREGIVYGNTSVEVRELYLEHGLNFALEDEPADYLSAELEFLAITDNKPFLKRFRGWVFAFTERVKRHSDIYGACSAELEKFLSRGIELE